MHIHVSKPGSLFACSDMRRLYSMQEQLDISFGERERDYREIIELEAGAVDGESIRSGEVRVQSIHSRPVTPFAGDLHLKTVQCTQQ